jgi:predicted MPP superfamily phosphohydrolase
MPALLLVLLHIYIGARLLEPFGWTVTLVCGALLAAMAALLVVSWRRGFGRDGHADTLDWSALVAVGVFSSLFVLTLARDVLLGLGAMAQMAGATWVPPRADRWTAMAVPLLALCASGLGYANARRPPGVRRVDVPIQGLAPAFDGLRIVQISDLHVGMTIHRPFVEAVVETANALDADLAVLTGDLVDGAVPQLAEHVAPLGRLKARDGVLAVTGNHEYYCGAEPWIDEFRRLGIRMLMNEHVVLRRGDAELVVAGIPDFGAHRFHPTHRADPVRALAGAPDDAPRVLLAHQPRAAPQAEAAGFRLQLSGHTHGGQFFPWNLFVPLQQPYTAGLHRHGDMWVYVSRGTGYWGPPKRLGAPSEITLVTLRRAAG